MCVSVNVCVCTRTRVCGVPLRRLLGAVSVFGKRQTSPGRRRPEAASGTDPQDAPAPRPTHPPWGPCSSEPSLSPSSRAAPSRPPASQLPSWECTGVWVHRHCRGRLGGPRPSPQNTVPGGRDSALHLAGSLSGLLTFCHEERSSLPHGGGASAVPQRVSLTSQVPQDKHRAPKTQ